MRLKAQSRPRGSGPHWGSCLHTRCNLLGFSSSLDFELPLWKITDYVRWMFWSPFTDRETEV